MLNIEKKLKEYVDLLSADETKVGNLKYILVYIDKNGSIHNSVGNDFFALVDEHEIDLTAEKSLKILLNKEGSEAGAIYQRKGGVFVLLVNEGF